MAAAPDVEDAEDAEDAALLEFAAVMRRLRAMCPWKREQTHRSLVRYLLEETHETVEAIESGSDDDLREELGDLLLQVYFHAVVAEEQGRFTLGDVAAGITEKMRRRNPHVFGPDAGSPSGPQDPAAVNDAWEQVKATEKHRTDPLDGLPASLPALLWATKVMDRLERQDQARSPGSAADVVWTDERATDASAASETGSPGSAADVVWTDERATDASAASEGESEEGRRHLEGRRAARAERGQKTQHVGERLLALVAEARADGIDAEQALRDAVRRRLP